MQAHVSPGTGDFRQDRSGCMRLILPERPGWPPLVRALPAPRAQ
jgi:hypothetical protein